MLEKLNKLSPLLFLAGAIASGVAAYALAPLSTKVAVLETKQQAVEEDVREIKRDVKELLRRK